MMSSAKLLKQKRRIRTLKTKTSLLAVMELMVFICAVLIVRVNLSSSLQTMMELITVTTGCMTQMSMVLTRMAVISWLVEKSWKIKREHNLMLGLVLIKAQ